MGCRLSLDSTISDIFFFALDNMELELDMLS